MAARTGLSCLRQALHFGFAKDVRYRDGQSNQGSHPVSLPTKVGSAYGIRTRRFHHRKRYFLTLRDKSVTFLAMKATRKKSKRGPVETVTSKGHNIPIYRADYRDTPSFQISYYNAGKRIRERSSTLDEARRLAGKAIDLLTSESAPISTFTLRESAIITEAVDILRKNNLQLSRVVREYVDATDILKDHKIGIVEAARTAVAVAAKGKPKTIRTPELVTMFVESRRKAQSSERYLQDIENRLSKFAKAFQKEVADITSSDITAWLDRLDVAIRSRNNFRCAIGTLFSYARRHGYLPRNIKTEAELVEAPENPPTKIGIYTPKKFAQILQGIVLGDIRAAVAIGGLAGLRSAEIHRLRWEDVHMAEGHIVIHAENAKTASRRIIPIVPSLKSWLLPVAKKTGPVAPGFDICGSLVRAMSREITATGVENVHNGLRHSYASYRLASVKSADQVALEMGNSPRKLFQNYRELVTESAAATWFSIVPQAEEGTEGKVVEFAA